MLRKLGIVLVAVIGMAGMATAALAADNDSGGSPPPCPGGTLKGTFHCTGPIGQQTCTEGGPWTCTLDKAAVGGASILGTGNFGFRGPRPTVGGKVGVGGKAGVVHLPLPGQGRKFR